MYIIEYGASKVNIDGTSKILYQVQSADPIINAWTKCNSISVWLLYPVHHTVRFKAFTPLVVEIVPTIKFRANFCLNLTRVEL